MPWKVPFVDFPKQFRLQEPELLEIIREVLISGDLIMRRHLVEFETNLAEFVGTKFAVGVSNCTDAIRLLAHALDIGAGDEIITVSHTFVATISPFRLRGAEPVLVDIGADHNMDADIVRKLISGRTRAIIPVHLNGRMCDMERICEISSDSGAVVIEDAAQALGARRSGKSAGSCGLAGVFSFYPAKLLGALGDAGAVVTDDDQLARKIRSLRDHGRVSKWELDGWGYNCRLDNLQAAILDFRLSKLPQSIEQRRRLASMYDDAFRGLNHVRTLPGPDADAAGDLSVFQNYPIIVRDRDALVLQLQEAGVETLVSWPIPLHRQDSLGLGKFVLPETDFVSDHVVSLPLYPELDDWQVQYVAEVVAGVQ